LVNVNSLEQLISINQTLTKDSTSTTTTTSSTSGKSANAVSIQADGVTAAGVLSSTQQATTGNTGTVTNAISTAAAQLAPGNLSLPSVNQSAQAVAQSLSGRSRVQ
jgi:hypothetical protein